MHKSQKENILIFMETLMYSNELNISIYDIELYKKYNIKYFFFVYYIHICIPMLSNFQLN